MGETLRFGKPCLPWGVRHRQGRIHGAPSVRWSCTVLCCLLKSANVLEIQARWKLLRASWSHNLRWLNTAHIDQDSSVCTAPPSSRVSITWETPSQPRPEVLAVKPLGLDHQVQGGRLGVDVKDHWLEKSRRRKYTLGLCHQWGKTAGRHQQVRQKTKEM